MLELNHNSTTLYFKDNGLDPVKVGTVLSKVGLKPRQVGYYKNKLAARFSYPLTKSDLNKLQNVLETI